jgi:hypothetical protein
MTEDEAFEELERQITYRLDSTASAVVSDDYYWIPIDSAPQGVKILLLGRSGVATMGHYHYKAGETQFWEFWAPLPRKRT